MKVLESRRLNKDDLEYFDKINAKVYFIRIDPEDISQTLEEILKSLYDLSWLSKFDEVDSVAFSLRAEKTINDIKGKFDECAEDNVTSSAGEYIVSELSKEAIVSELNYLDIPIGELLGKKKSGNHGFDFHSENTEEHTIIFGEAKYQSNSSAHGIAVNQIKDFIDVKKDIEDLPELKPFVSNESRIRAINGKKGFAAAFSSKSTASSRLIKLIADYDSFKFLCNFEEVILVAVNL